MPNTWRFCFIIAIHIFATLKNRLTYQCPSSWVVVMTMKKKFAGTWKKNIGYWPVQINGNKFATGQILKKPVEVVEGRILGGWAQKSPKTLVHDATRTHNLSTPTHLQRSYKVKLVLHKCKRSTSNPLPTRYLRAQAQGTTTSFIKGATTNAYGFGAIERAEPRVATQTNNSMGLLRKFHKRRKLCTHNHT